MALELMGKIGLDGSGFERGLHHAGEEVKDFVKNATIAAFGFYGIEQAIHKTVETATELVNQAKKMDVTIEQLQLLKEIAKDGGVEIEQMAAAMGKLDEARGKIIRGDEESGKLLKDLARLGISEQMLKAQTSGQLLIGPIADAVKTNNIADISIELRELLGKAFRDIVPALRGDFDDVEEKLKKFGLTMDAETAVKLKEMGNEFEMIGKIITTVLGPALVQFADWLLRTIASSKLIESVDFMIKRTQELAKLPDFKDPSGRTFSADQRAQAANDFRDRVRKAMTDKEPFEQFRQQWKFAFSHVLADFKGGTWKEFTEYLNTLTEPVQTATAKAAKDSKADIAAIQKSVNEWFEKIKQEADRIEHPVPANPPPDDDAKEKKSKKGATLRTPEDALIKVGNFLGSNGNTIDQVNRQKLDLMRQQANTLASIDRKISNNFAFSGGMGMGVPIA